MLKCLGSCLVLSDTGKTACGILMPPGVSGDTLLPLLSPSLPCLVMSDGLSLLTIGVKWPFLYSLPVFSLLALLVHSGAWYVCRFGTVFERGLCLDSCFAVVVAGGVFRSSANVKSAVLFPFF